MFMDNLFVWLLLGPFIYSWQLAGPIVALLVAGYIRFIFGYRFWVTLSASFLVSFLYYVIVIPSDGMLGGLWIIKVAMGVHTALLVSLILWIFERLRRRTRNDKKEQEPFGK